MIEINRISGGFPGAGRINEVPDNGGSKKAEKAVLNEVDTLTSLGACIRKDSAGSAARAEKVESLRLAVASGTYSPDPLEVARKILGAE